VAQGLLDRYFELLPGYQNCSLADLSFKRVLFGGFPCYSSSPLQPQFDRIIQASSTFHKLCLQVMWAVAECKQEQSDLLHPLNDMDTAGSLALVRALLLLIRYSMRRRMMVSFSLHHLHLKLPSAKESVTPTYVTCQGCMT
jgi:hypothetical protein